MKIIVPAEILRYKVSNVQASSTERLEGVFIQIIIVQLTSMHSCSYGQDYTRHTSLENELLLFSWTKTPANRIGSII